MADPKADRKQDKAVEDSFPASDPPATGGIVGPRAVPPRPAPETRDDEARPKGTPTHDRHATETAHQWEDEESPGKR
jgi:hypothetical protein